MIELSTGEDFHGTVRATTGTLDGATITILFLPVGQPRPTPDTTGWLTPTVTTTGPTATIVYTLTGLTEGDYWAYALISRAGHQAVLRAADDIIRVRS